MNAKILDCTNFKTAIYITEKHFKQTENIFNSNLLDSKY